MENTDKQIVRKHYEDIARKMKPKEFASSTSGDMFLVRDSIEGLKAEIVARDKQTQKDIRQATVIGAGYKDWLIAIVAILVGIWIGKMLSRRRPKR